MDLFVRTFEPQDADAVVVVWRAAGLVVPWNDPYRDIERKLAVDPEGFLVAVEGGRIVGAAMVGYEGHRGWIQYLGVAPERQGSGVGRLLVEKAVELLRGRGCPKVNLQVRRSNERVVEFYRHLGFKEDDVMSMGLRLVEDGKAFQ